jgi:glycerol-3-phosphate cytidylyltransferase
MYNRIGFTCSSFDLLHAGHIAMLKESSENCDRLIVGLNVNPCKGGKYPVQSVVERYVQLSAVKFVDEIIPYNSESELIDLMQLYHIDVRFIGEDYRDKSFTGDNLDMEVFYNKREHRFSSSALKQHVKDVLDSPVMQGTVVKDNETYMIVDNVELNGLTVSTTILHPEKSTTGHSHKGIEEVYYFISGNGDMVLDDKTLPVEGHSVITIPDGVFHRVINNSKEEDLNFICTFNDRRNH